MKTLSMLVLRQHFEQMGIRDHTEVAMLLYLACTTRKMRKQVSVILAGLSSVGKSTILKAVLKLIPPEDRIELSFITKAALLRLNNLRGKILAINESIDDSELASPFRQLASEGEVRYQLILNGEATEFVLRGPAVVLETTTDLDVIDFQNRNRGFVVSIDPSKIDLDARIDRAKRRWMQPNELDAEAELIARHHDLQNSLDGSLDVRIPYADRIAFRCRQPQEQRLWENFMRLVAAIAFLQQNDRPKHDDPQGKHFIDASVEDYAAAKALVTTLPLETGDDVLSEEAATLFFDIKRHPEFQGATAFTRSKISEQLPAWTPKRVRNHIDALVENDLLNCSVGKKNRKEYTISGFGREVSDENVFANALLSLSSPDDLSASLACPSLPDLQDKH